MSGTYRKEGSTARAASLRGMAFESTTRESGVAGHRGGRFFSASAAPHGDLAAPSMEEARALHDRIATAAGAFVSIERLRVVAGTAAHRFEPEEGDARSWSETLVIAHATMVARSGARASVLRGGATAGAIDLEEIAAIARAFAAAGEKLHLAPDQPLLFSPAVAATLAAAIARDARLLERVPIVQEIHPDYRADGDGLPIERTFASGAAPAEWPNVFRPSYRSPATPALMHVELAAREGASTPPEAVEMIELLRPPHPDGDALALEALCRTGGTTFLGAVRLPVERLAGATAEGARAWYPFHAGAWGRRTRV